MYDINDFLNKEIVDARNKLFIRNSISINPDEAKIIMKLLEYELFITVRVQKTFIELRDKNNELIDYEEIIYKIEI
jgi:hypothetical protein